MKKEKSEEEGKEGSVSIAESVLNGAGNLMPGIGELIKGLKKSDAFAAKLQLTDSEIQGGLTKHRSRIPGGMPPSVARREAQSKEHFNNHTAVHYPVDKGQRDILVDIFEEKKKMRVIAELPGVNQEDIKLDLTGDILIISANRGNRDYYKYIKLPRSTECIIGKIYNNGILEVTLN